MVDDGGAVGGDRAGSGDGAGSLGKSSQFTVLTQPESGFSVYGMEIPPTQDSRYRRPSGAVPRGLSGTLKVRQPAHAMLNIAAGKGGAPPP